MAGTALTRRGSPGARGAIRRALLAALAGGLLLGLPAKASALTYCVDVSLPECEQPTYSGDQGLQDGLTAAQGNPGPDTVRVGSMTYEHPSNSAYSYNDGGTPENTASIVGSGQGAGGTVIAGPATLISDNSFLLDGESTISNMRFTLPLSPELSPGNVAADTGLSLSNGATASGVTVTSDDAVNLTGVKLLTDSSFENGTVSLPSGAQSNLGIIGNQNGAAVRGSTVTGAIGIAQEGASLADTLTVSRTRVASELWGIQVVGGSVDADDTLIEIGSDAGAIGVHLFDNNNNSPIPRAADLRHMTIVGPSGSTGIRALARATTAGSDSTVTLADSVIDGPNTPVALHADNGRTASLTSNYSNFDDEAVEENDDFDGNMTSTGNADFAPPTNHTELAPGFVGGSDYHLAAGSPLIDIGDPAPGGPPSDVDGQGRVQASTCGGAARRDIGADEFAPNCTPPEPEPGPGAKADRTLTLDANKPKVEKGRKVRLAGQLEAAGNDAACEASQTVEILRDGLKRGAPQTVATLTTDAQGNYATKLKVRKTSLYTARTLETAGCEGETSDTEKVRVQKPKAAKEA